MTFDPMPFRKKLLAEKDSLEAELATVGRRNPQNPKDWEPTPENLDTLASDRDEVADRFESFEENVALTRQLEARLAEVSDALERIESGSYGRCTECGAVIETDRLNVNPAAQTCKAHLR